MDLSAAEMTYYIAKAGDLIKGKGKGDMNTGAKVILTESFNPPVSPSKVVSPYAPKTVINVAIRLPTQPINTARHILESRGRIMPISPAITCIPLLDFIYTASSLKCSNSCCLLNSAA